ncbi:MAG TPA: putative toxin-antitoxin system toxin component, PIN family [Allocoleopsis sp.]
MQELEKTLARKKFDRYLNFENRRKVLTKILLNNELTEVTEKISICRDEKDNKFLELAVSGSANMIISGDQDLLVLNPFRQIEIITPEIFINRYNQEIHEI